MSNNFERTQVAQWILDKQLEWISAADAKVAVIIAIDTAMFASLATAYANAKIQIPCSFTMLAITVACIIVAIFCAAMSLFPRIDGPKESLIFFGPISEKSRSEYVASLNEVSLEKIYSDISSQIHRNAEIANAKHRWVKNSMEWSFIALIPWAIAIYILVK